PSISGTGPSTQSAEAPRLDNSKSSQEASAPATAVSVTPMGQRAVQANAPSAGAAMAPTSPQPANSAPARVATAPSEPAQTVRGVPDNQFWLGFPALSSGPAKDLGQNMKRGIESVFNMANAKAVYAAAGFASSPQTTATSPREPPLR